LEPLDSGDWGVIGGGDFGPGSPSHAVVDEAHDCIYFSSNKDDVHDSQLYRLSLRDKSITRITKDAGTHNVTISPDRSAFVDVSSNSMTPSHQDFDRMDGSRIAAINSNNVPELAAFHLSPIEFLDVSAEDGTKLCAMMIKPPDFDPAKKYPALISVYGGPRAHEVVNRWGGFTLLWHEMMAEKGYIIFQVDNRGSYERGHAFETPIYHHFGKVELEDQLSGVKYLKSLPYVDSSRIGIWGWSYGGYMTLYSLLNAPGVFKAGVSVAPVTDWHLYDTSYTERYMGRPQDNPEGYKNSSPVTQAANLKDKLLLIHATGDDNVHFANTAEFLNDLIDNGKYPTDLLLFPGRGHGISDAPARTLLFERITQFLLNNL
ncbi:MAG: prolyl oligopeptidase family serine peptidase, partial [Blastocatellia bacterium]